MTVNLVNDYVLLLRGEDEDVRQDFCLTFYVYQRARLFDATSDFIDLRREESYPFDEQVVESWAVSKGIELIKGEYIIL